MAGNLRVTGLEVTGSADISTNLRVTGSAEISTNLSVAGNATVDGDLIISELITHNGDTNTRIRFGPDNIDMFTADVVNSTSLRVNNSNVIINEGGEAGIDFRVESNNLAGAILVDGGDNTAAFGTNVTTFSSLPGEAKGDDVSILLSGSVGSVGTATRGTTLAAGDLVVSGTMSAIKGLSGSLTQLTDGTSYLIAGANTTITSASNGAVTIATTGGAANAFSTFAVAGQSNVVADSGTDTLTFVGAGGMTITTNAGSDTITFTSADTDTNTQNTLDQAYDEGGSGAGRTVTVDSGPVVFKEGSIGTGNTVLAVTGSAIFGNATSDSLYPTMPGPDTNFFVSGSMMTRGTTTRGTGVFGGDLVVSGGLYTGRVASVEDNTSFIDLTENNIEINANHAVSIHDVMPSEFQDTNFFVSGSIGSKGNPSDRGTSVFGGDLVVSGTIFNSSGISVGGKIERCVKNNNFTLGNTNELFFPGSDGEAANGTLTVSTGFLAPYSGSLRKLAFRSQNDVTENVYRFYVHPGSIPGSVPGSESHVGHFSGSQTGNTTKIYDLENSQQRTKGGATTSLTVNGNFNFEPGDFITVSHETITGTFPSKVNVILFLDYDTTSIIE